MELLNQVMVERPLPLGKVWFLSLHALHFSRAPSVCSVSKNSQIPLGHLSGKAVVGNGLILTVEHTHFL